MTTTSSLCRNCGTIAKSGKSSCCGRGGSWFGNCGSPGNAKLHHTWYEGIRACTTRTQSKAAISRQSNAAQQRNSPNGFGTAKSKIVIGDPKKFTLAPANTATPRRNAFHGVGTANVKSAITEAQTFALPLANTSAAMSGTIAMITSTEANALLNASTATLDKRHGG